MTLSIEDRKRLAAMLDDLKWLQSRCMGGEDPQANVLASNLITKLRLWLRDDPTFIQHLDSVMKGKTA